MDGTWAAALEKQIAALKRLAENRAVQLELYEKGCDEGLRRVVEAARRRVGLKGVVTTIVQCLVTIGADTWPEIAGAFRSELQQDVPPAPPPLRFADGLAEAEATASEVTFYEPGWNPPCGMWETVDDLGKWCDPLQRPLWPEEEVVENATEDCRMVVARHSYGQPPEVVVPLFWYTVQLYTTTCYAVWSPSKGTWISLPLHHSSPLHRTSSGTLTLTHHAASLVRPFVGMGLQQLSTMEIEEDSFPMADGYTLYTSPGDDLYLMEYENHHRGDYELSPLNDSVMWIPTLDVLLGKGPPFFLLCDSGGLPPSGVLEYIYSRKWGEVLQGASWRCTAVDLSPPLFEKLGSIPNMANYHSEAHSMYKDLVKRSPFQAILEAQVKATEDTPTPQRILSALMLQRLTWEGNEYLLGLDGVTNRVVGREGAACVIHRLKNNAKAQVFQVVNHTMRSLQTHHHAPVLVLDGVGPHVDGEYSGGSNVLPFVRDTRIAQWQGDGFLVSRDGIPVAKVWEEEEEAAWDLRYMGSLLPQVRGMLFHITQALLSLPPCPSPTTSYRGLQGVAVPQYTPGAVLLWAAFSSSSIDRATACSFALGGAEGAIFSVRGTQGRNISRWSRFARENELLLPPNTWLKVKNALTEELRELSGAVSSQVFELEIVTLKEVHMARVQSLLPNAKTAAGATVIFQIQATLQRGDGVVDLTLPNPSTGATNPVWQLMVKKEHDHWVPLQNLPVTWVTTPHTASAERLNEIHKALPIGAYEGEHRPLVFTHRSSDEAQVSSVFTDVALLLGIGDWKAVGLLDCTFVSPTTERLHTKVLLRGRSVLSGSMRCSWNLTLEVRKTGGRPPLACGSEGADLIASALRLGVPLRQIRLVNNCIGYHGVNLLLEALRFNRHVIEIELDAAEVSPLQSPVSPSIADALGMSWRSTPATLTLDSLSSGGSRWKSLSQLTKVVASLKPRSSLVDTDIEGIKAAIQLRCQYHLDMHLTMSQMIAVGIRWPLVVVKAMWDVKDLLNALPIQQMKAYDPDLFQWLMRAVAKEYKIRGLPPPHHVLLLSIRVGLLHLSDTLLDLYAFDVEMVDDGGHTALHWACRQKSFDSERQGAIILQRLITPRTINARCSRNGWTPLHNAINFYYTETAKVLLENGASTTTRDFDARTPLAIAIENNFKALIELLRPISDEPVVVRTESRKTTSLRKRAATLHASIREMSSEAGKEYYAAVRMQLHWRSFQGRKAIAERRSKEHKDQLDEDEVAILQEEAVAATILAAMWRGFQTRRRFLTIRSQTL